jgi:hypothetical protein
MSNEKTSQPQTPITAPKPAPTGNPGTTTDVSPKPSSTGRPAPTGNQGTKSLK